MTLAPHMTEEEAEVLSAFFAKSKRILEFGCGGSTLLELASGAKKVWSVDNVAKWIDKVSADPAAQEALHAHRLNLIHVDIGPTGKWGMPSDDATRDRWPAYHTEPWRQAPAEALDFVFVDGRFRVACALQAMLRVKRDCLIGIHDFWDRSYYHFLLDHMKLVKRTGTLGVFSIVRPRRVGDLVDGLLAHQYDPR